MSKALTTVTSAVPANVSNVASQEFVTFRLGNQLFGISVLAVQDVMRYQTIARIPLSPEVIAGSLNVRGRIVTAYDMRCRLGLPLFEAIENIMMVVVDFQHELFALMVDSVGDVLSLSMRDLEKTPNNIDAQWRALSAGVFKLEGDLLIVLDVAHVMNLASRNAA